MSKETDRIDRLIEKQYVHSHLKPIEIVFDLPGLKQGVDRTRKERVVEWARLPSGRIVAMTKEESYWFEADGTNPILGSRLTNLAAAQAVKLALKEASHD